ncbi:hypothetical protein AAG570_007941 [Ranatra chinensis]|uniref:Progesterone receptor n=1 Tax=Ranatra chinensis TaxID=642074 RepID=A0ABD0XVY8_9HEMI
MLQLIKVLGPPEQPHLILGLSVFALPDIFRSYYHHSAKDHEGPCPPGQCLSALLHPEPPQVVLTRMLQLIKVLGPPEQPHLILGLSVFALPDIFRSYYHHSAKDQEGPCPPGQCLSALLYLEPPQVVLTRLILVLLQYDR